MKIKGTMSSKVSALAMLTAWACAAGSAVAQAPADELVVTGSRVTRNGFQAPTPLSVVSAAEMQASGAKDLSEFVNEIPAVAGSWDLQSRARQNGQLAGITSPALRNLGTNRTLVLLDGHRQVSSAQTGQVDTAMFPSMLIGRVDMVTGGASAAYGSDAVSGVVNYVLDKTFIGLKGELAGGISTYGDDQNVQAQLAKGFTFDSGRGRVLLSGELYKTEGVFGTRKGERPKRDWLYNPGVQMENPAYTATNGQPFYINLPDLGDARAIKGALIYSGPLRGTAFGDGGQPFQFNFGNMGAQGVAGTRMSGGDWALSEMSGNSTLDPQMERQIAFGRVSYDFADNLNIYIQGSAGHTYTATAFCCIVVNAIRINPATNAFLPASVRTRAATLGVTTFTMGSYLDDNKLTGTADRWNTTGTIGAEGRFNAFGSEWNWDAYGQYGRSFQETYQTENLNQDNFLLATDAVVNPATGAIVCAITLTNPNHPCKPYNPFGWGVVSREARSYVGMDYGDGPFRAEDYEQWVAGVSVSGEPFSLWAGPVSLAAGLETRKDELDGDVDPISQCFTANTCLGWANANASVTKGQIKVTEGFVETVIPLAVDQVWARSLEFNGAVRLTDYSTSGLVTSWKAGATWQIVDDLRLRTTYSRDIRAPNMSELFTTGSFIGGPLNDPFLNLFGVRGETVTVGNLDLKPEKADTLGVGAVVQPRFIPGLDFSVDYYQIEINDAIQGGTGGQATIDNCFAGVTAFCNNIVRRADGTIAQVFIRPTNFVKTVNRGVDFEAGYRVGLDNFVDSWSGDLNFRYMATRYIEAYSDNGLTAPVDTVGQVSSLPTWRHRFSVSYSNPGWTGSLSARWITDGTINNTWIECNSGCPTSTVQNRTVQVGANYLPAYYYFDAALTRKLEAFGSEIFFNVRNLLDQDPPRTFSIGTQGTRGNRGTSDGTYDMLGRTYRVGLRFKM